MVLLVSSGLRIGVLLNIPQCTGLNPCTKNYEIQNVIVVRLRNCCKVSPLDLKEKGTD